MSGLAPLTRDGTPSVAYAIEQAAFGSERVDAETVMAWARANGVDTTGSGSKLARINSARFAAKLPVFELDPRSIVSPVVVAPKKPAAGKPALAVVPVSDTPPPLRAPGPRTIQSESELIDLVAEYDGTITVRCGKALAGWLWSLNTANRPLQPNMVERFRRILRDGAWQLTGEPIIVSREGSLSDGQHRIKAILDTGIEADIDLRFGIARAAFSATGTGSRRTSGNVLAIAGRQHASAQAAIARLLHHYDAHTMGRSNQQVEASEVLAIAEAETELPAIAAWMSKARFSPVKTASFGLVLAVAARSAPIERVLAFADLVQSGLADATCPARLLHVRLRDAAMARERLHQTDVAALTTRAWNGWQAGRPMQRLILQASDRSNDGFPAVAAP